MSVLHSLVTSESTKALASVLDQIIHPPPKEGQGQYIVFIKSFAISRK